MPEARFKMLKWEPEYLSAVPGSTKSLQCDVEHSGFRGTVLRWVLTPSATHRSKAAPRALPSAHSDPGVQSIL